MPPVIAGNLASFLLRRFTPLTSQSSGQQAFAHLPRRLCPSVLQILCPVLQNLPGTSLLKHEVRLVQGKQQM